MLRPTDSHPGTRPAPGSLAAGARALYAATLALGFAGLSACDSDDSEPPFTLKTSSRAYSVLTPLITEDGWSIVLANEALTGAAGTDLNDDGDTLDQVAIGIDLRSGAEYNTGVAASQAAVEGTRVFLTVDETGNNSWDGDLDDDEVLVTWTPATGVEFVAEVDDVLDPIVGRGSRVWFTGNGTPAAGETDLFFVDVGAPTTPFGVVPVTDPGGVSGLELRLIDSETELLVYTADETPVGVDLNGDADTGDDAVLFLVEARGDVPSARNVGLALPASSADMVVTEFIENDVYLVGFLVDETDQGATNLNGGADPAVHCTSGDTDTTDAVLHFLRWELGDLAVDTDPPVNARIAARLAPSARLLANEDFVAALVNEADQGDLGCDMNQDGDQTDVILRWAPTTAPTTSPEGLVDLMHAVNTAVPGGAQGAVELAGQFMVADLDTLGGLGSPENFLFWADPASSVNFTSDFFDPPTSGAPSPPAITIGIDWMSSDQSLSRVPVGLLEEAAQVNLNNGCLGISKDGGAPDQVDTIAAWVRYDADDGQMRRAGAGWAVPQQNSGLVIAAARAFFRASEADDGFDWNNDGDTNDFVLFRTPVTVCSTTNMGVTTDSTDRAIFDDGLFGAVFFVDETAAGADVNGDGVTGDFALRFFRF
jgi:hypothetical protein